MTLRTPIIKIFGPSGTNIVPGLGPAFLRVDVTDNEGGESDSCTIVMSDKSPWNIPPAKGAKYAVDVSFQGGPSIGGIYAFENFRKSADPESGKTIEIVCRAADFIDKMKQGGSEHYDEENGFGTAGKIFEHLAKKAGVTARIDPEIANIKIPYRLRYRQSPADFASDLADEIGAVWKPQNGLLTVRSRGKGLAVSGNAIPQCIINEEDCNGYDFDIDPRPQHKEVIGSFMDINKGVIEEVIETTKAQSSRAMMLHPLASKDEAQRAAKSAGKILNQSSGTGSIETAGNPYAQPGAEGVLNGFQSGIDAMDWEVKSASHSASSEEGGWLTSVEVQTKE